MRAENLKSMKRFPALLAASLTLITFLGTAADAEVLQGLPRKTMRFCGSDAPVVITNLGVCLLLRRCVWVDQ